MLDDPRRDFVLHQHRQTHHILSGRRTRIDTEQERADFRNDVYAAICFDAEGSEKILPVWMDTAKMRAARRLSPLEVKQEIARPYEDGAYRPPSRAGISYMIAPLMRTYPTQIGGTTTS